jgi:hypothetical protein
MNRRANSDADAFLPNRASASIRKSVASAVSRVPWSTWSYSSSTRRASAGSAATRAVRARSSVEISSGKEAGGGASGAFATRGCDRFVLGSAGVGAAGGGSSPDREGCWFDTAPRLEACSGDIEIARSFRLRSARMLASTRVAANPSAANIGRLHWRTLRAMGGANRAARDRTSSDGRSCRAASNSAFANSSSEPPSFTDPPS